MRYRFWIHLSALMLAVAMCARASAQDVLQAYIGATLLPIDQPPIEDGVMVVHRGKIIAVGAAGNVSIPASAVRHDVAGRVIMPGLICTHSHIGGGGGADSSAPIQPEVRIYDSINVRDSGFKRAVAGGLTTLNIMPGSGHLLSGQTVYVKLRGGNTIEDLCYFTEDGEPMGGIKMANGTNPQGAPPFAATRGKAAALVREQYIKAREHHEKLQQAEDDPDKLPERNLAMEALIEALEGKRIIHHHTHRHDDIVTVLRIAREFGWRVVLHHVSEAWKVAEAIAAADVPCSVIMIDSPGGKLEAVDLGYETGAVLEKAGVNVAFHTDDWITDSRVFFRSAALAVRAGMTRAGALRALTLAGAEMMDLQDRIGSLTPGKDADFIVLDGDPLSIYTKVLETYAEGARVFDRSDPKDRLYAVGGYGAGHDQNPYFCCFDHLLTEGD